MICAIRLQPEEWADNSGRVYDLFSERKYSMSYVKAITRLMNAWGTFLCRKSQRFFEPIKNPTGREREEINDANEDSEKGGNKESDPVTPAMLEKVRSSISEEHYCWIYCSVWFGLRPSEVDRLVVETHTRISKQGSVPILEVYQPKLVSVPREKRWKLIPCITPEQVAGLKLIKARSIKRPLSKSVAGWFNENVGLYGGRKGFVDLMQSRGQQLEDISQWMGHMSIETTWRSYKDKRVVRWRPPTAA